MSHFRYDFGSTNIEAPTNAVLKSVEIKKHPQST